MILAITLATMMILSLCLAGMAYEAENDRVALAMFSIGIITLIGYSYLLAS